jgi:signal peptidase I
MRGGLLTTQAGQTGQALPSPERKRLAARSFAQLLRDGIAIELTVCGRSMRPLLRDGDVLSIEPAAVRDVRPGEIVLIDSDAGLIVHRLMRIDATTLRTRGDGCIGHDQPHPHAALVGKAAAFRRDGVLHPLDRGPVAVVHALYALLRT